KKLLNDHGLTNEAFEAEYAKRLKEKHGVDLVKVFADRQREVQKAAPHKDTRAPRQTQETVPGAQLIPSKEGVPVSPISEEDEDILLRETVSAVVKDKDGFYKRASDLLANGQPNSPLGQLEKITIRGDTATGQDKRIHFHIEGNPDGSNSSVGQPISVT